ncbi:uncharacterized protein EV422DRAFT_155056 [Fimicolochytrium jonesii]|uniref:uncharacterized protein n=1 Tax=Fimicolochytrium jonesii TaxID=1396493 RepID=UPI0022FE41AE|nr:uncharacterized protein EV422DRAFT_155056 [Fimicolochytrium jonesii]KAI8826136.1 hypothetical protein EV422DRAFT_155056 [Fimicolochytrium jonesii]
MSSAATEGQTYQLDLGHQEIERIVDELEKIYRSTPGNDHWLPAENVAQLLCTQLGYEDVDEFEASLEGNFSDFLKVIPLVETKTDDTGRLVFRFKPEVPQSEWVARRWTLRITDRSQLWWVLYKSPHARIEIPELEFEISADGNRRIDTLYNHIGAAVFNLTEHIRGSDLPPDQQEKTLDCIQGLETILDVDKPFTIVVHDPSGLSDFSNTKDLEAEYGMTMTFD